MRSLLLAAISFAAACNPVSRGDVFSQADAAIPDAGTLDSGTADAGAADAQLDGGLPCTPAQDRANWPVRVVFVVQNSGAMCLVDPPGSQETPGFCEQLASSLPTPPTQPGRITAIRRFFADNANRPNVSAAVVSYGTNASVIPFSSTMQPMPAAVDALQGALGKGSNLQGALETTKALIEQEVQSTPASIRSRSRYVVIILSTGLPQPRCTSNDSLAVYASPANPALTWPDSVPSFCNSVMPGAPDPITGFMVGGDLNQNAQLFGLVDGMLALDGQYGLGDVRVFTRLLMNDANIMACGPICMDVLGRQSLAESRSMGTWLMTELATRGQGTFVDPGTPAMLSLSTIDTSEFTTFCGP